MPLILGRLLDGRQPLVRVTISNEFGGFGNDTGGPAAVRRMEIWALLDTGATNCAIDERLRIDLALPQQGVKQVLYPGMTIPEFRPAFVVSMAYHAHYTPGSPRHDWPDLIGALAFDLAGRSFQAVIGMDTLSKGKLTIGGGEVSFEF